MTSLLNNVYNFEMTKKFYLNPWRLFVNDRIFTYNLPIAARDTYRVLKYLFCIMSAGTLNENISFLILVLLSFVIYGIGVSHGSKVAVNKMILDRDLVYLDASLRCFKHQCFNADHNFLALENRRSFCKIITILILV